MDTLTPHYVIFNLPLYARIEITKENQNQFLSLMRYDGSVREYHPFLKEMTTFRIRKNPTYSVSSAQSHLIFAYEGVKSFELSCVQTGFEVIVYLEVFKVDITKDSDDNEVYRHYIQKIGQTPSLADLNLSQIKDYKDVLESEKLKELNRGIGLAAHGVGIGSFVYLRRIFEYLIEEAHITAKNDAGWDETIYRESHIQGKIEILKHHLPSFLVENKVLYSILSKGIHQLDEDDCLKHFEVVKLGIELILDERVEFIRKKKKLEEARKKIEYTTKILNTKP